MYSLAFLAFSSFVLALLLTPLVRNLARSRGLVDQPGDARRIHTDPVPRLGGVAVVLACVASYSLFLVSPLAAGQLVAAQLPFLVRLLPAVGLIFAVGLFDDLHGLSPLQKVMGQVGAATLAVWAGVYVQGFVGFPLPVWIAAPLTVLWLVGCTNAFNLIDGVDGLAAGVGLFATITIVLAALLNDSIPLALATVPLAGALLGFLRFNFNPATIFLGDCGSLTVGFLLGCYGALWSQKAATMLGMTAPLMALAVPLLDTALAIARRFLRLQPIWTADRSHIHHRLLDRGLTQRKVVLLLYGAAGLGAVLSVLQSTLQDQVGGLVLVLFCAAAWIGVQHLGYVEFGVAGRMFVEGAFRRHLNNELALRAFEDDLTTAKTAEQCWNTIREACCTFGFAHAELRLKGSLFADTLVEVNGSPTWSIQIPLMEDGYLRLTRCFGIDRAPAGLVPFAQVLHKTLSTNGKYLVPPEELLGSLISLVRSTFPAGRNSKNGVERLQTSGKHETTQTLFPRPARASLPRRVETVDRPGTSAGEAGGGGRLETL